VIIETNGTYEYGMIYVNMIMFNMAWFTNHSNRWFCLTHCVAQYLRSGHIL